MPFVVVYFSIHTYSDITCASFSVSWLSNRFIVIVSRLYGQRCTRRLAIGSGLGHLVGQLEDTFETYGMDINYWAVKQSKSVIKTSALQTASAQELPYKDGSFNVVTIKHIVAHLP